ncbi:T9SS type A sorting domain-containing protein [Bacteroidota bacterium]
MINKIIPFILLFLMGSLSAQNFVVSKTNPNTITTSSVAADTVNVLAIMVSFQADRDGTTFGNGKFGSIYTSNYGNSILDPLPHDKQYFEDHLLFTRNYFKNVSNENLFINYHVLPDTFSVSQTMRNYSPDPNSDDFTPMGNFATEAWTISSQIYPGFDFSEYDLFTIFHAGAGRDISLPGSIGNERDLPSVYLSPASLKDIFGNEFDGIPISGSDFKIPNTLILPETESRELSTVNGTVLFEITINGLIAASIGSYLGVPDLFDTETGLSAIGRFGLMDGQGLFAYNGTYPPEPSPWTKILLGWVDPVVVELENTELSVVSRVAAEIGDTVIIKIPINSSEYYLVENRIRDANNDGSIVTYKSGGVIRTKTFAGDSDGYQSFNVDSLEGVVIEVDEYDWAVPGDGIVIWHIDEQIISAKIASNTVNADKDNRGIDIEEADGIQDIGESFISVFGDQIIGEGTDEDLWHANNPGEFFENRFAKDTRPNSKSNSGANSLITLEDFSEINNRMNFKVEFGDSVVKPLFTFTLPFIESVQKLSLGSSINEISYNLVADSGLIVLNDENILLNRPLFSKYKTPSINYADVSYTYGAIGSSLKVIITDGTSTYESVTDVRNLITAPPVVRINDSNEPEVLVGTDVGKIFIYDLGSLPSINPVLKDSLTVGSNISITKIISDGSFLAVLAYSVIPPDYTSYYFDINGNSVSRLSESFNDFILTRDDAGNNESVLLVNPNLFFQISAGTELRQFEVPSLNFLESFALTDLKQDGTNYIIINNGLNIEAYNLSGALADNFPVTDPEGIGFIGTPLAADFEGDGNSEIISVTEDGRIFAIDGGTGQFVPGFPISSGARVDVTPVLYNANGKTNLVVLNDQNVLSAWSISSVEGKLFWSEENGNAQNNSFVDAAENTNRINDFFPTSRAYNYPNPVYEGKTYIRYYVSEDSKINIKIFDLAGDYVAELNDEAQGGMDNETIWNVSDIQSGVYFARIEASSNSGKSEFAIIKIAIVK